MKEDVSRSEIRFEEAERRFEEGLTSRGKKNAKHAEEVRQEIERTRKTMASFLKRKLPEVGGDDWLSVCVQEAVKEFEATSEHVKLPDHDEIDYFDLRGLAVVMQYNLPKLTFERGEAMTDRDIRRILILRNSYVHLLPQLNHRNWKNDIDALRVFRSRMQTDREIELESYAVTELPEMEKEARLYGDEIDAIQQRINALVESLVGLGGQVKRHAENDAEQFEELERQRARDAYHDDSLEMNSAEIKRLIKRDRIQRGWIIGLVGISLASLIAATASLLMRK